MWSWLRPRKLQVLLSGPLLGMGLLTLVFVSWLALQMSYTFLSTLAIESAEHALSVAKRELLRSGLAPREGRWTALDRNLRASESGAIVLVMDQQGRILANSSYQSEVLYQGLAKAENALEHPDCLIRCPAQEAHDRLGTLGLLVDVQAFHTEGPLGRLYAALGRHGPWVVMAIAGEERYGRFLERFRDDIIWGVGLLLMFVICFSHMVSRQVTQPILELNEAAKQVADGNFEQLLRFQRHDEIGELSQSMSRMGQRLRGLVKDLEGQVEKRTAELQDVIERFARTNQELERANGTKDRIFSIIAHDLKSPFNALKGYSGIINDSFASLQPDQLKEMIEKISVSSEEAHGLLENLLHWAMMQSGSLRANWNHCNLRDIVLEVVDLMRVNAKVKHIQLEMQVSPETWIFADRIMVATVIRNLIANALKFTYEGRGRVTIKAYEEKDRVIMLIVDNGVGMRVEAVQKILRRDLLGSERGTAEERGTGLGLQLVHEFILLNQGQLDLDSHPGEGSRFIINWKRGQGTSRLIGQTGSNLHILYIDDAEDNHDLVRIYLKEFPWKLEFALDGREGLKHFLGGNFDVGLRDLNMPGMNGIEATKKLRAAERDEGRARSVVIAFTSSLLQSDIDAAIEAGCDAYLVKPIKKQNLIHVLQRYAKLPLQQG